MQSTGIFVTGTDTGAGKTMVSCAILAALHRRGLRTAAFKPVETGCPVVSGQLQGEDCTRLAAAAGSHQAPRDVAAMLLAEPAAPLVAAEAEGRRVERKTLLDHHARIAATADFVLCEGAGGLMVPLADGWTTRDLARELGRPMLLVVGSRLGCINHALLSLEAMRGAGLPVLGYVVNEVGGDDAHGLALATNRDVLRRFAGARELGVLPHVPADRRDDLAHLAALAETHLDLDAIAGRR